MTNSVEDLIKEVSYLKKTVSSLQEELRDHRASQLKINAHFQIHLDLYRTKEKQLHWSIKCVKYLLNKMKESDIRMDTLMKVLGGRIENTVCKCGEQFSVFQREESSNSHHEEAISQSKQQHENILGNLKCQQGQSDRGKNFSVSKKIQTNDIQFVNYSSDSLNQQSKHMSLLLPNKSWEFVGDESGKSIVKSNNDHITVENSAWRGIVQGRTDCAIAGKYIELPGEFNNLIVTMWLKSLKKQILQIEVAAVNCPHNEKCQLPVVFRLHVKVEKLNGSFDFYQHDFAIGKLHPKLGKPNTFNIPISNQYNKLERPHILCRFEPILV